MSDDTPVGQNRTEAPTNDFTHSQLDKTNLTEDEFDFVTLLVMVWRTSGQLATKQYMLETYGVTAKEYEQFIVKPKILDALTEHGVNVRELQLNGTAAWRGKALTPRQLLCANTMVDITDTRSDKKKLQDMQVSLSQYQGWLRDPGFSQYIQDQAEKLIGISQHEANLALLDKVRAGDIKAIQYYHDYTNKFRPTRADAGDVALDFKNLLTSIVEIVIDCVSDPNEAAAVADEMKKLITARNVAGALMDPEASPIELPEIAPARKLTDELKVLIDHGVGMGDED